MKTSLLDLYHSELEFLMQLRQSINTINNRIHDKVSLIARELLKLEHPNLEFRYSNAAAAGFDIKGFEGDELKLIAESRQAIIQTVV